MSFLIIFVELKCFLFQGNTSFPMMYPLTKLHSPKCVELCNCDFDGSPRLKNKLSEERFAAAFLVVVKMNQSLRGSFLLLVQ